MDLLEILNSLSPQQVKPHKFLKIHRSFLLPHLHKLSNFPLQPQILSKLHAISQVGDLRNGDRLGGFDGLPIDGCKEGMIFDGLNSLCSQAMHEVFVQQLADEVFGLGGDHPFFVADLGPFYVEVSDVINHLLDCLCAEGTSSDHQLVCHYSQAPPIYGKIIERGFEDYLRSDVVRSTDQFHLLFVVAQNCLSSSSCLFCLFLDLLLPRLLQLLLHLELGKPEVGKFQVSCFIKHQIFRFEITMDNIEDMQMLNGQDYLSQIRPSSFLFKVDLFIQHLPQVTTRQVLQYKHMAVLLTKREGGFDQMLACYFFEDFMLSLDGLYTALSVILRDFDDLQSIDVSCFFPTNQENLSKGTLAQNFEYLEIQRQGKGYY